MLADGLDGALAIGLEHGVGHAVGERAIDVVMHLDELEGQMRFEHVDDQARAAVAGIDHHFKRLELGDIDIGEQMRDVARVGIELRELARYQCRGRQRAGLDERAHVFKAGVGADGA